VVFTTDPEWWEDAMQRYKNITIEEVK